MNEPQPLTPSVAAGPTRILVVGAGAFGRNHLRVWRELADSGAPVELAAVVDTDLATRERAAADFGLTAFASVAEALAAAGPIHAASVCVPTRHHAGTAETLLRQGIHCLVEKPLAATLAEADALLAAAHAGRALLQPGHLERFNPAVTAALAHRTRPMFFEAHRLSLFTPRSLDVDVVLDLMIHDLDIVLSLTGSPVREVRAVGLPVLSRRVDIANVRVEFESGCVANFTASRVSTERVRKLRFFQPQQYLSLDFARQDLLLIDVAGAADNLAASSAPTTQPAAIDPAALTALAASAGLDLSRVDPAVLAAAAADPTRLAALAASFGIELPGPVLAALAAGGPTHPTAGLSLRKLPVTPGEPLRLELQAFLHSARTGTPPVVSAEEGRAALALALQINSSMAEHAHRAGLFL